MRRATALFITFLLSSTLFGQGAFRFDAPNCAELAARIENECRNAGSDEATCQALRQKFEALCRNSQPPAPPVFDCMEQCRREAELELRSCMQEAGRNRDRQAQCRRTYEARLKACAEDCEAAQPSDCPELCLRQAAAVRASCRNRGGDPRSCELSFQAALRECIRRCGGVPVAEPRGCPGACVAEARRKVAECVQGGGDPKACWAEVQESLKECLAGCESVPPFPCPERCRVAAAETFFGCLAEAGSDGELTNDEVGACSAAAEGALEECLAACQPAGEPPTCEARCNVVAKRFFDVCVEEGNDVGECAAKALEFSADCVERCDALPQPRCAYKCIQGAREVYEQCMTPTEEVPDPDPEACRQKAIQFLEECRTTCERPNPPGCPERCKNYAERVRARCVEEGGDEATCNERAERARNYCAQGCPPYPKPCPEVCAQRARLHKALCIELGGDPQTCERRAREMFANCIRVCERPPKPPCVQNCIQRARHVYADCIEAGGDCDSCRAQAMAWLNECAAACAPRPSPCAEECARAAREQLASCLDAIDEEALAAACKEALPEGTDEEIAACVAEKKAEAERACKLAANASLSSCLKECRQSQKPEPPTCEERCDLIAEKLLALCEKLDPNASSGEEPSECELRVAEFLEKCKARCAQPRPPGPCQIDCGRLAARIQEECQAAGGENCEEVAARFRERCQARAAEHCQDETIANDAPPRRFFRGDSNRDGKRDIADPIHTLGFLFRGQGRVSCEDASDANDDGRVDIADPITTLMHLFWGSKPLPEPLADEGYDETVDAMICE